MLLLLSYLLALLIGLSIGIMGSGGAILAVPILYYVAGYSMLEASVYSLFVVGATSAVGAMRSWKNKLVNWSAVLFFGIPSVICVYLTRLFIVPLFPKTIFSVADFSMPLDMALLMLFAVLMLLAARSMLRKQVVGAQTSLNFNSNKSRLQIIMFGVIVGALTAILGAGGGFLIIPALVLFMYLPMKEAIGTSMFIVAMNALNGFIGSLLKGSVNLNYQFLLIFSLMAIIGLFIGMHWSKRLNAEKLKRAFAFFVLGMGLFIIVQQILNHLK
ncbi:MAG: sulfite exporter TauE/SafE family protein [Chitinophagales bacterium]|jgi:hypothetical protein|nr:sulfite exporter TauE/SafE family protein [Chitinophagales bacterium]